MASEELYEYVKAIGIGVFDLAIGYLCGQIIDLPFNRPKLLPIGDMGGMWKVLGLVAGECAVTTAVLIGMRRLMYPSEMDDLTGGMFFMQAILRQTAFWDNLSALWAYVYGKVARVPPSSGADNESSGS